MKVAVVGAGRWGVNLVRNFSALDGLQTICDVHAERLEEASRIAPGARLTRHFQTVLDDTDVTAVAIATPAEEHGRQVRAALLASKDVFVEKPLCLSQEEAAELVELARTRGRILMVGHLLRYHPAVTALERLVASGELGAIRYIYSHRLNLGRVRRVENVLWSFAPHDISVILALMGGLPVEVKAHGGRYLHEDVEDATVVLLRFPNGVKAHIFVSWLHPFKEQKLVVVGERKMAVFNDLAPKDKLLLYPFSNDGAEPPVLASATAEPVPFDALEPLQRECAHFLECLKTRNNPVTAGEEGLQVLTVLDACQQALAGSGTAVPVGPQTPLIHSTASIHRTACVDENVRIGAGTRVWHFCHISPGAVIGSKASLGQNCFVAPSVRIGNNVRIQNNVSVYSGVTLEDDVFLGPSCVFTNVSNPRAQVDRRQFFETTVVRRGATVGANATIVCGVQIGRYAFIGAGAVVTSDVPAYALMLGNPARRSGWMSRHGHRLMPAASGIFVCPESGLRYREDPPGHLSCLDVQEGEALPEALSQGTGSYEGFKVMRGGLPG